MLNPPLTTVQYYFGNSHPDNRFNEQSFYQIGHGMFGGPSGTYGRYSYGPNVKPLDMKRPRQRQTGE